MKQGTKPAAIQHQKKEAANSPPTRQNRTNQFLRAGKQEDAAPVPPATSEHVKKEEPKDGKVSQSGKNVERMDEATTFAVNGIMRSFGTFFPLDEAAMEVRY